MIREKIVAITIVVTVVIIGILYLITSTVIMANFQSLEDAEARAASSSVSGVISHKLASQDVITRDWAFWNDAYSFVADGNQRFVEDNLDDATFPLIRMNVIIFANNSGAIVFDKAYDLDQNVVTGTPDDLLAMISPGSPLMVTDVSSNVTGILLLEQGPMLLTARPILTSDHTGPAGGTLIFGRFLDDREISEIEMIAGRPVEIYPAGDVRMPPAYLSALSSLENGSVAVIRPVNSSSIIGYSLMNDVYGDPALVIGTIVPRDISAQGYNMLLCVMAILIAVGVFVCALVILLSERIIVAPLTRLHRSVSVIGPGSLPSARVPVEGNDEVAGLARAMNSMLDRIDAGNALYRGIVEDQTDIIFRCRQDGTITFANGYFCRFFQMRSEDVIGNCIWHFVPEADREVVERKIGTIRPDSPIATHEMLYKWRDTEARWGQWVARGFFDRQNRLIEYQVVGRDITGLKKAEESLRVTNEELEQRVALRTADLARANEALTQEVASHRQAEKELQEMRLRAELYLDLMGHDINNLNQIALGYLEMAACTINLKPEERDLLATPKEALNNSSRLVRNVMKLQRARNCSTCSDLIDLGKLLGEVQADYSSMPDRKVIINYSPVAGCMVRANDLLKELFSNLVHNAIKHNPNPAVIDIALTAGMDGYRKAYRVDISDNGPGIPDSLKCSLFNREQPCQLNISGKGLGLYLVKVLADSYGGYVRVEDRVCGDPSKGSRFIVVLPSA